MSHGLFFLRDSRPRLFLVCYFVGHIDQERFAIKRLVVFSLTENSDVTVALWMIQQKTGFSRRARFLPRLFFFVYGQAWTPFLYRLKFGLRARRRP